MPNTLSREVWTCQRILEEVLRLKEKAGKSGDPGPWWIVHGLDWDYLLDDDWIPEMGQPFETVRQHLRGVEQIVDVICPHKKENHVPNQSFMLVSVGKNFFGTSVGINMPIESESRSLS